MRLDDISRCIVTGKPDAKVHLLCGLTRPALFTFCGKKVLGVTLDTPAPEDLCATCLSSAKYWGFK